MEGQAIVSDKLSFIENKRKFKAAGNVSYGKLITAANLHGLIYIGFADKSIKAIKIADVVEQCDTSNKIVNLDNYTFSADLSFKPQLLTVSRSGYSSILLVAGCDELSNCPVIEFFDIDTQASIGKVVLREFSGARILDYAWQPVYYESIVAICLSSGHLLIVALNKKEKRVGLVYKDQKNCLTCCWSPKGKNLAIGLTNGQVRRLEIGPLSSASTNFTFKDVDKSVINFNHLTPDYQAVKLRWINKKYLICAHARPKDPSTTFSIFTIKPTETYRYFTNVCMDSLVPDHYSVDIMNLTGAVICVSNASGDVSIIGMDGTEQVKKNDLADWSLITIDAEGARVELPLSSKNEETYSRGTAITFSKQSNNHPILLIYTSDGLLCSYVAVHSEFILKLPEVQKLEDCPIAIPILDERAIHVTKPAESSIQKLAESSISMPKLAESNISIPKLNESPTFIPKEPVETKTLHALDVIKHAEDIKHLQAQIDKFKNFRSIDRKLPDEINYLRAQFDEIQDIHATHREALDAIKDDIEALDLGMLENLYLIEYIKSQSKKGARRRTLDPITLKKVDKLSQQSKSIAERLEDLNTLVDNSWEDFCRKRTTGRRLNSLDLIYKTLATNQKIINLLKKKVAHLPASPATAPISVDIVTRQSLDPARMRALKEFLASRSTVPVRRPEVVKHASKSRLQF